MKQKLKGFTLMELIIVMGIFSLIMVSVLQLLEPVSNYFVRSTNFENTTACVDNIKRAIEGNLKYADRVRVFYGYDPYKENATTADKDSGEALKPEVLANVEEFYNDFFAGRHCTDTKGTIRLMVFDNRVKTKSPKDNTTTFNDLELLRDYNDFEMNRGEIDMYTFTYDCYDPNFDNGDEVAATVDGTPWYVNRNMYGNYDYSFRLANQAHRKDAIAHDFNTQDFQIQIFAAEIRKKTSDELKADIDAGIQGILKKSSCSTISTASFSMKNVLDKSNGTESSLGVGHDFKITLDSAKLEADHNGSDFEATKVNRFRPLDVADGGIAPGTLPNADMDDPEVLDTNCFYFIFTLPEETEDSGEFVDFKMNEVTPT
ncbi:MAG: type II secretion system GspH family protein [Oscillospiraceae bacterium]|nr:type II secretion system GspH family protein [Oscillospiraceae bacterium]